MFRFLLVMAALMVADVSYGQCVNGACTLQPRRAPVASAVRHVANVSRNAVIATPIRSWRPVRRAVAAPRRILGRVCCGCRR